MLDVNKKTFGSLSKRTDKEEKKKKKKNGNCNDFCVTQNAKCPKRVFNKFPKISMTWF